MEPVMFISETGLMGEPPSYSVPRIPKEYRPVVGLEFPPRNPSTTMTQSRSARISAGLRAPAGTTRFEMSLTVGSRFSRREWYTSISHVCKIPSFTRLRFWVGRPSESNGFEPMPRLMWGSSIKLKFVEPICWSNLSAKQLLLR